VVGVVGVERLARDDAPAVLDLVIGNVVHTGVAGQMALFLVVRLNLAEKLRSGLELVRGKVEPGVGMVKRRRAIKMVTPNR
jgi:hypothetical protein